MEHFAVTEQRARRREGEKEKEREGVESASLSGELLEDRRVSGGEKKEVGAVKAPPTLPLGGKKEGEGKRGGPLAFPGSVLGDGPLIPARSMVRGEGGRLD